MPRSAAGMRQHCRGQENAGDRESCRQGLCQHRYLFNPGCRASFADGNSLAFLPLAFEPETGCKERLAAGERVDLLRHEGEAGVFGHASEIFGIA